MASDTGWVVADHALPREQRRSIDPHIKNGHGTAANSAPPSRGGRAGPGALVLGCWFWNVAVPDPKTHRMFLVVWTVGGLLLAGDLVGRAAGPAGCRASWRRYTGSTWGFWLG